MTDEEYRLDRFVTAQDRDGTYARALDELHAGRKRSHWMWFIFPQLAGLGLSETSRFYAITSLSEARAYLSHPVLGERLRTCTQAVLNGGDRDAAAILGSVDAQKLHSSMTLFHRAAPDESIFGAALAGFFAGVPDPATDRLLTGSDGASTGGAH